MIVVLVWMLVVFLFYVNAFKDVKFLAKHKVGNICTRDNNMSLLPYTKPRCLREKKYQGKLWNLSNTYM